uniref:Uncharacterized protein n=1 Tax=Arundo donax TaxID=35708 RepID=A0A0A9FQ73_ARUDO
MQTFCPPPVIPHRIIITSHPCLAVSSHHLTCHVKKKTGQEIR